jgi:hypothetical protein
MINIRSRRILLFLTKTGLGDFDGAKPYTLNLKACIKMRTLKTILNKGER